MSSSLNITAYAGKDSAEFKKHFKAVQFCIENDLSFPKETSEFFKGKVGGSDLEEIKRDCILPYIENGVEIPIPIKGNDLSWKKVIKVADIPKEVDEIIIEISY